MEKYIEKIIEIVLDNVSCEHTTDADGSGKRLYNVSFCLDNEQEVIKKCLAAIPEASIDEEFIKQRTQELWNEHFQNMEEYSYTVKDMQDIIRSLINEVLEKITFKGD